MMQPCHPTTDETTLGRAHFTAQGGLRWRFSISTPDFDCKTVNLLRQLRNKLLSTVSAVVAATNLRQFLTSDLQSRQLTLQLRETRAIICERLWTGFSVKRTARETSARWFTAVWSSMYDYFISFRMMMQCSMWNPKQRSEMRNEMNLNYCSSLCVRNVKIPVIKTFFIPPLRSIHKYFRGDLFSVRCAHINPLW